jgi:hypothetical protein
MPLLLWLPTVNKNKLFEKLRKCVCFDFVFLFSGSNIVWITLQLRGSIVQLARNIYNSRNFGSGRCPIFSRVWQSVPRIAWR